MTTIRRLLPPIACLVLGLGLLAGCGGDDGGLEGPSADGGTDPQTILDNALGSEGDPIESGVLEVSLDVQSGAAGAVKASVGGPFQSNGEDELPSFDFDVSVDAQTSGPALTFDGTLTTTPDGLFVGYGGSAYQLDDATFGLLQSSYQQSSQLQQDQQDGSGGSLSQFGVDPSNWLTDLTNEGTEDVDGTETVHVSGTADIPRLVEDLGTVAGATGQSVDTSGLQQLRNSVKSAQIDVYADASNSSLRRLDVSLELADPSSGGTDALSFSIGIADPNSSQDIEAPDDAQPLEDLLGQIPGLSDQLGGITGGSSSQGATSTPAPAPASPDATEKYYDCVGKATGAQGIADCQKLLG